jgi:hypothetical protein
MKMELTGKNKAPAWCNYFFLDGDSLEMLKVIGST